MKVKISSLITITSAIVLSCLFVAPSFADQVDVNNLGNSSSTTTSIDCSKVPPDLQEAAGCSHSNQNSVPTIVQTILRSIILSLGIVAVIFIIIGGYNYMTSAGDASKVEKAKKTILYAVIGLIICALAFVIVNFVIQEILKQ